MFVTRIPGRLRLRRPQWLEPQMLAAVAESLDDLPLSVSITPNATSGSLLILCAPEMTDEVAARLEKLAKHKKIATACASGKKNEGLLAMSNVKKAMAVGLGVSLVGIALSRERLHIVAGGLFVAALSRHLFVYRKRVWVS